MDATNRNKLIILVVDDDIGVANALGRLLRGCGHTVHLAYTTVEGLELAARTKPDLILHDLTMPAIDGHEAARRLRRMPLLRRALLIACSGSLEERKAREAGFDGWLAKPIGHGDLEPVLAMASLRIERSTSIGESDAARSASE
jgi:CheY-like chemotaxis protein